MSEPADLPEALDEDARKRDRLLGLGIIVLAFTGTLGLSLWAKRASRPELSEPPGPPTTEGVEGFPSAVDPVQTLGAARALTRRKLLRGFAAEGVKSDGTVDLSEGPGRIRYAFQSPPGEGPQPPREPGTLPSRTYCGKQNVHLRHEGLVADPDVATFACAVAHTDPMPEPRCGTKQVWRHALERGAQADRLARIEYFRSRIGPAWRFELPGSSHRFTLYGDCGQEITGADAIGSVP